MASAQTHLDLLDKLTYSEYQRPHPRQRGNSVPYYLDREFHEGQHLGCARHRQRANMQLAQHLYPNPNHKL